LQTISAVAANVDCRYVSRLDLAQSIRYDRNMSERIDAIFENGVFRPEVPVNIPNGERVSLDIERQLVVDDDLADVQDLLDLDYMRKCQSARTAPSLEEVREMLSVIKGSISDDISRERDER
jgi:predicted DNA-binding antitoxin AbrB/MazE fold protein